MFNTVTFEVIVVEAEVVCMVRFNLYTVGCSHAFVGLFGLQSGSAGGAGDEVIIEIIRVVVRIEDGAPEFFVGEEAGRLGNETGLMRYHMVAGCTFTGSIMMGLPDRVVVLRFGTSTATMRCGEGAGYT